MLREAVIVSGGAGALPRRWSRAAPLMKAVSTPALAAGVGGNVTAPRLRGLQSMHPALMSRRFKRWQGNLSACQVFFENSRSLLSLCVTMVNSEKFHSAHILDLLSMMPQKNAVVCGRIAYFSLT